MTVSIKSGIKFKCRNNAYSFYSFESAYGLLHVGINWNSTKVVILQLSKRKLPLQQLTNTVMEQSFNNGPTWLLTIDPKLVQKFFLLIRYL